MRSPGKLNRKRRARWQRPTVEHLRHHWLAVDKIMSVHKSVKTTRHRWSRRKHPNRKERKPVEHCSIRTHWHQRNQRLPELERAQKTTTMKWLLMPYIQIRNSILNIKNSCILFLLPRSRLMRCITTFWTITLVGKQRAPKTWMLVSKRNYLFSICACFFGKDHLT